mgnify:CR=1 FL=1
MGKSRIKKVLVTGGAGYVGAVLVPKLLSEGYEVVVLDAMFFTDMGLTAVKSHPGLTIIVGDIRDEIVVKKSLAGIDAVIHLASISNDPSGDLNPKLTVEVNYEANILLARLAKKAGVQRFINVSSSSVYGVKSEPEVTEDLFLEPLTIYSKAKADAEPVVMALAGPEFAVCTIRPATICGYSPKMRLDLSVNILTMHALTKGVITVFGGKQKRPNIHIADITDYYVELLKLPAEKISGGIYNAGYENHTILGIAEMVRDFIGPEIKIEVTETNDHRSYHISPEKIKRELNLVPKKTLRDAVLDIKKKGDAGEINWNEINFYNMKKMKQLIEEGKVS